MRQTVEAALADRAPLEKNLDEWNDMYEMVTQQTDFPYVGAANIFVPLIPTQLESLLSYVAAKALVPRFYLVKGLTAAAEKDAGLVERYYNAELRRQRGDSTWYQAILRWLHLSLRDGTAYMEAVWKYRKSTIKAMQRRVKMEQDPETQAMMPVPGPDGQPQYEDVEIIVEDVHNDVELRPRALRNLITVPAAAKSVNDAMAAIAVDYLYEDSLRELIEADVLDPEEVEMALSMVPSGTSELPLSPQPTGIYEVGRQVGLGAAQGTQVSKFFRNRGPIEVYRSHTRQYDLDKDGQTEENVVWVVKQSGWRMLGWMRYNYLANLGGAVQAIRPFFAFSPYERPGEGIGFAIPDRLAGLQNEQNAQRNQRLNEGTIRIAPPWWENRNANFEDDNFSWGPNQKIRSDAFEDIRRFQLPDIPQQAYMDEAQIGQDAAQYTGLTSLAPTATRKSALQARQEFAFTSMRLDMIVMNFRFANRTLINFIHALKRQFIADDQQFATASGQRFTLTPEQLGQDYQIDVSGASDPMDAASRRQEELAAYEIFMKDPDIASNPMRRYYLRRKLAETFDWADIDNIIGTEQEAQQMVQAQQAQQMLQHVQQTIHGPGGPGGPGGPPGGGGQPNGVKELPMQNSPMLPAAEGQVAQ